MWFEDAIHAIEHLSFLLKLYDYVLVPGVKPCALPLIEIGWVLTLQQAKVGNAYVEQAMQHLEPEK